MFIKIMRGVAKPLFLLAGAVFASVATGAGTIQQIDPSLSGGAWTSFGWSIALDDSTETFVAASPHYVTEDSPNRGSLELYKRQPEGWVHTGRLRDLQLGYFGSYVAAGSGWIAAFGSDIGMGPVIDLFHFEGGEWTLVQRLAPRIPGAPFTSIDRLEVDGDNLIVALSYWPSTFDDPPSQSRVAAYRYAGGQWQDAGSVDTPFPRGRIGRWMTLAGDTAVVSLEYSPGFVGTQMSSFVLQGGQWVHASTTPVPEAANLSMAHAMVLCAGELIVAATPVSSASVSGKIQRYVGSAAGWTPIGAPIAPAPPYDSSYFGQSLACSGQQVAITGGTHRMTLGLADPLLETLGFGSNLDGVVIHQGDVLVNGMGEQTGSPPGLKGVVYAFLDPGDAIFADGFEQARRP